MKKLILLLLLYSGLATGQTQNLSVDSLHAGKNATSRAAFTGKVWLKNFNGNRPFTGSVMTGTNPGTNELVAFLNTIFYPSQVPTASVSGGGNYELHSAGTFPATLNWIAGRQAATEPLTTITVAGTTQTFSQPAAPGTVNGTQFVTVTYNTNINYTNIVATADGKTANATTSFNFLPKRYTGRTASTAAISTDILASAGGINELTSQKAGTFSVASSGSNRVFFAYPANFGDLTSINIGGLESLGAFNKEVISLTNASGYTQNYNVYTSLNATASNLIFVTN